MLQEWNPNSVWYTKDLPLFMVQPGFPLTMIGAIGSHLLTKRFKKKRKQSIKQTTKHKKQSKKLGERGTLKHRPDKPSKASADSTFLNIASSSVASHSCNPPPLETCWRAPVGAFLVSLVSHPPQIWFPFLLMMTFYRYVQACQPLLLTLTGTERGSPLLESCLTSPPPWYSPFLTSCPHCYHLLIPFCKSPEYCPTTCPPQKLLPLSSLPSSEVFPHHQSWNMSSPFCAGSPYSAP